MIRLLLPILLLGGLIIYLFNEQDDDVDYLG